MRPLISTVAVFLTLQLLLRGLPQSTAWVDLAKHTVRFVTVDGNVQLEVLDWGGEDASS